jgi:histidyl-tRNA synthetase
MSSAQYRSLKGMQDILPPDIYLWQKVEQTAQRIFSVYGFQEIRLPVMESTSVFTRSIGENTDIVEKEMYTFTDKGARSVSLRPEGTASVVRSYVENSLYNLPAPQKFYYSGPMFRYERPQSGRFRQFYQIGVEAFGDPGAKLDAEVIAMLALLLSFLGLEGVSVQINSIGCEVCRPGYREALITFFSAKREGLCPDCLRRYDKNPLRILDCKASGCIELRQGAPRITDHICGDCRTHFEKLQSLLSLLKVSFSLNPEMVRGLDYYTRTTFEVTSQGLGAQNAVAAGGRYDRLVREFGGPETPAVGFALGIERVVELLKKAAPHAAPVPLVFIASIGDKAGSESLGIAQQLRQRGLWVETGDPSGSLKSQMRRADRLGARYVFIIGDEELLSGRLKWKGLDGSGQGELLFSEIEAFLTALVEK